jgi:hypothetical protein
MLWLKRSHGSLMVYMLESCSSTMVIEFVERRVRPLRQDSVILAASPCLRARSEDLALQERNTWAYLGPHIRSSYAAACAFPVKWGLALMRRTSYRPHHWLSCFPCATLVEYLPIEGQYDLLNRRTPVPDQIRTYYADSWQVKYQLCCI